MAEQFKSRLSQWSEDFFKTFQALEEENKNLKLKILELEIKETIENDDEEIKSLKLKIVELTRELEKREERENNCVCFERQNEQRHEKRRMSGSVMAMSPESGNSPMNEVRVKEESVDEFMQNNLQTETQSMEEDMEEIDIMDEIDIKEEDVAYGQSKSDYDNSIYDPTFLHPSGGFGAEVETDSQVSSSSHFTENVIRQEIVKPHPEVPSQPLSGRKKPYLTTRTPEIHKCENCSATFDTQFKLRDHNINKSHIGEKESRPSVHLKTQLKCSVCEKSFATQRVLANHMKKTHTEEKSSGSLQVDEKGFSAKGSCTVEKVNPSGQPKKKRKVVCETELGNDEDMPGMRDGIDTPSEDEGERNPLKRKEILGLILSNLGKNDLLNARLVSRDWNDKSLEVLRNSKFTQMLGELEIERYILFATSNELRPFSLPFHLDFSINLSSKNVNMFTQSQSQTPVPTSHVESLCQIFGPQCVSTLSLTTFDPDWTEENMKGIGLIECLALISPGLKTLNLKRFYMKIDFLKHQVITFPKLTKLICNAFECEYGRTGPGLSYISLIENSPNLEDLILIYSYNIMDSRPLKLNQLKSLSLGEIVKPQNILDKFLSSSGPRGLRELSIGLTTLWNSEETIIVYNILNSVSTTLRSLKCHGYSLSRNTENLRFPKLPHLEHLGLEYDIGNKIRLDPKNIDFSPKNFPSLKSIELPIGYVFAPSPVQSKEDDDVRIEFPNFNKLTLRVNNIAEPAEPEDFEVVNGPLKQLQQIFPTPSKLSFVNVGGCGFVKYVLYRIMKSNWSKNIQQIEMIGFSPQDLAHMLNRLDVTRQVALGKWYRMLKVSLKTEFQSTMKRIRMEFEEIVAHTPDTIILRRRCHAVELSK